MKTCSVLDGGGFEEFWPMLKARKLCGADGLEKTPLEISCTLMKE